MDHHSLHPPDQHQHQHQHSHSHPHMDYNYYASGQQQPYQYLGFGDDSSMLPPAGSADTPGRLTELDHNTYMSSTFNYAFDNSLGATTSGLTPGPAATTSTSPPPQPFALPDASSRDAGLDAEGDARNRRSSSEEKESLTPAQSRRKAQNRAAQRAFRERKERHVRDLEAKLNLLTTTTSSLQSDNERLKLMLQRAQTENEVLRATASSSPSATYQHLSFVEDLSQVPPPPSTSVSISALTAKSKISKRTSRRPSSSNRHDDRHQPQLDASRLAQGLLMSATPTDSSSNASTRRGSANPNRRLSRISIPAASVLGGGGGGGGRGAAAGDGGSSPESGSDGPSHMISASATWDLIQSHPLYLSGAVDIGEVCERLKRSARCEGMGPMFDEDEVRRIIEEVGRSGSDELI